MEGQINANVSDSTYIRLIDAAIEHPFIIAGFFVLIWFSIVLYKQPSQFVDMIKALFFLYRKPDKKKVTKADLENHQIFKDLVFWREHRINQLYGNNCFPGYDKAKLAMGRAILTIKLKDTEHWLSCFIKNTDFEDPYLNIRSLFQHKKEKHKSIQWDEFKKRGIPNKFVEKFIEVSRIHENYILRCLDDLLSDKVPMTIYERVYLLLGFLDIYYSTLILETNHVIQSINGDLRGEIFDGMVVGGNDYRCYPVPSRDYIPLVETKLHEILIATKASRASIFVLHDFVGDDHGLGYFSKIYEYELRGYTPTMKEFQYKNAACLVDILPILKQHQGFCSKANQLNEVLQDLLNKVGILAIYAYPMFVNNQLKGFIGLEYNVLEIYEGTNKEETMDTLKKYTSLLNIYIDYTSTGFSYEGNAMREARND